MSPRTSPFATFSLRSERSFHGVTVHGAGIVDRHLRGDMQLDGISGHCPIDRAGLPRPAECSGDFAIVLLKNQRLSHTVPSILCGDRPFSGDVGIRGKGNAPGKTILDATVEASAVRFRPILMTSVTFILGVLPLLTASGAGASARKSLGLTVATGMLASTCLAVLFVPAFYVVLQRWSESHRPGEDPGNAA
jgi:hypothetical protein